MQRLLSAMIAIVCAYTFSAAANEARIHELVMQLTLKEKIDLLAGQADGFETKAIPRLGIPQLKMADGPLGVRLGSATAFPSGLSMAASFDRLLVRQVSGAIALEAKAKGRNMMLGPCVGITRIPIGGRNFEGMGEDPFLTAEISGWYIKGFKDQRVLGSAKHFGLNDQEYNRMTINSVADERAMHEIHFPAFERAVQEGVASVMASYNQLNGKYASENEYLLNQVLKTEFGFKGFVVSDWGATHSTVPAALAGLDLEMPVSEFFGADLLAAVISKQVPEALIDDKVSRILRSMFGAGLFEPSMAPPPHVVNSPQHRQLALQLAQESHVLLKNEGKLLPIDFTKVHRIAVVGPNAAIARVGGGGSSEVVPFYSVSILDGLRARVGKRAEILTAESLPEQIALAARADLVVLALGFSNEWEGEGVDRSTFALPPAQESLLESVLAVNPHTVVVLTSGNPVDMNDWVDRVPAIFFTSYAGQEGGHALADLLLGTVNPSGHLPFTMLNRWEDIPGFAGYPETNGAVIYTEGLYVGYRHYDKAGLSPVFPFGHGLSYTDFIYSEVQVTIRDRHVENPQVDVQFTVRNRGARSGSEVAQLYVRDENPQIDRPVQELKGFERIRLNPGESQKVTLHLNPRSFAYYDVTDHRWRVNPGKYGLRIGSSSRDIRLRAGVNLH